MTTYNDLLNQAWADPHNADYHALRMAYARTDSYAPYAQDGKTIQALNQALHNQDLDTALAAVETLLAANYLDIEAHMAADYVYIQREDAARSDIHRAFARGLIDAILATGTGRDFDSALIVLSIAEEYLVLRVLGLAPAGQRLVQHEGHWFDVLTTRHSQMEDTRDVYFNIDLPISWKADHL